MPKQVGDLKLYDLKELVEMLGTTEDTLRLYLKTGKLAGQKLGVKWYVSEDGLREYFNQKQNPPAEQ